MFILKFGLCIDIIEIVLIILIFKLYLCIVVIEICSCYVEYFSIKIMLIIMISHKMPFPLGIPKIN